MKHQKSKVIRVYVAMSGGVDSSVAATLLKKGGFNVVGVFMKPWSPNLSPVSSPTTRRVVNPQGEDCLWKEDREDAMKVAAKLDIPLLTWDFSKEYKKRVTDYMIREYQSGRTPNPDVMCNKEIKFRLFLKKALKEGADYIATGHYVRIRPTTNNQRLTTPNKKSKKLSVVGCRLLVAKDKNKDQSYFLWTLTQEQLKYCLFPIGDYVKSEVRRMAKKFGLSTHNKKDSQGVCFVGPLNMKEFLKNYIKPKRGKILNIGGNLISYHDGVFYYTIGQRHGLDIKNGQGPYYVISKDIRRNVIYVGEEKDLGKNEMRISNVNFISEGLKFPAKVDIKIRYRSKSVPVVIRLPRLGIPLRSRKSEASESRPGNSKFLIRFLKPTRAITPGQSAVFYKGQELLGGGIII